MLIVEIMLPPFNVRLQNGLNTKLAQTIEGSSVMVPRFHWFQGFCSTFVDDRVNLFIIADEVEQTVASRQFYILVRSFAFFIISLSSPCRLSKGTEYIRLNFWRVLVNYAAKASLYGSFLTIGFVINTTTNWWSRNSKSLFGNMQQSPLRE